MRWITDNFVILSVKDLNKDCNIYKKREGSTLNLGRKERDILKDNSLLHRFSVK